ncbi:hypothetical protein FRC20_011759 [Serendipita sp. 405]|nr:hypothetical protein FRC20_011759 [Serendipita sp. 405]
MQLELLIGPALSRDQIHLPAIRGLTRRLNVIFPEIVDETHSAFATQMEKGKTADGWTSIKAFDAFGDLVSQLNHRAFVGLPLCRDEKWNKTMVKSAAELTVQALLLRPFPESRRADAHEYMKSYGKMLEEGVNLLTPLLEQRRAVPEDERPNDLLTIIMSCVSEAEPDPRAIIGTFLLVDQVAQSTTQMTFMHALYYVVAYPEYAEILREEIELVNGDGPLAYRSLEHLHKLDSFLRETQRLSGLSNFAMARIALQDYEFSNGVKIPKGEMALAIGNPVHHDSDVYEDPLEFKPFRFSERAQAEALGKGSKKYDMITPSPQFLAWGLGRHACPGRWYASMVVKHLMVYIITKYDVKLPDSAKGKRPADWNFMGSCVPNMTTQLLFKRRDDVDWE